MCTDGILNGVILVFWPIVSPPSRRRVSLPVLLAHRYLCDAGSCSA
jgi:hypothetical protein